MVSEQASSSARSDNVGGAVSASRSSHSAEQNQRKRLPLGRNGRRLSFDLRLRLWLLALALPTVLCTGWSAFVVWSSATLAFGISIAVALGYALIAATCFEQITRPLQTLSNVVAALREDDFSFRARGARSGDSLGDLALEINSLASSLQAGRGQARDALTLVERVMHAMRTPVLAFAPDRTLRLLNPAAADAFSLSREPLIGRSVESLGLDPLYAHADGAIYAHPAVAAMAGDTRWSVRRSTFRLGGVPHELLVLSDVDAALREEERVAWQRLVRVLSHEINNSLTPITSLAGSLLRRLPAVDETTENLTLDSSNLADLHRGLHLVEDRAVSLHHFLQAYQQLARLPQPNLQPVSIPDLIARVVAFETRMPVELLPGPEVTISVDAAQIEQLLINLLGNAVELRSASKRRVAFLASPFPGA